MCRVALGLHSAGPAAFQHNVDRCIQSETGWGGDGGASKRRHTAAARSHRTRCGTVCALVRLCRAQLTALGGARVESEQDQHARVQVVRPRRVKAHVVVFKRLAARGADPAAGTMGPLRRALHATRSKQRSSGEDLRCKSEVWRWIGHRAGHHLSRRHLSVRPATMWCRFKPNRNILVQFHSLSEGRQELAGDRGGATRPGRG